MVGLAERIMSTTILLAKSLRTATELGGSQNGLSRASALFYNDDCTVCKSWKATFGKGKGPGGKADGKSSKGGKDTGAPTGLSAHLLRYGTSTAGHGTSCIASR